MGGRRKEVGGTGLGRRWEVQIKLPLGPVTETPELRAEGLAGLARLKEESNWILNSGLEHS